MLSFFLFVVKIQKIQLVRNIETAHIPYSHGRALLVEPILIATPIVVATLIIATIAALSPSFGIAQGLSRLLTQQARALSKRPPSL
jgi:hypothetical protein